MYVCICNAINDKSVRAAIERGARTPDDIMLACDARFQCGACRPEMEEMLAEHELEKT